MPDFLVIGAGKSGTTSLHEYLNQHPKIFMGKKEPNFFAYQHVNPDDIEDPIDREHYFNSIYNLGDYQALFAEAKPNQVIGEVSNTYISKQGACENIKNQLPQVKLIAILRHPADRLYSRYTHLVREGSEVAGSYTEFFNKNSVWWRRSDLINEGFYYQRLKPFFDNFPKENIRVYLYEDFIGKTDEVVADIFEFLGVDPNVKVGTGVVYNKSGKVKNQMLNKLVGQNSPPILLLKRFLPGIHKVLKANPKINGFLNKLRSKNLEKPGMSEDLRQRIINEIYKDDIQKLAGLIDKDLTHWLK